MEKFQHKLVLLENGLLPQTWLAKETAFTDNYFDKKRVWIVANYYYDF